MNDKNSTYSAALQSYPTLASITTVASTNNTFNKSLISLKINDQSANALLDSGSEENFIHPKLVETASLSIKANTKTVLMADSSLTMKTKGTCTADVCINGRLYNNCFFSILSALCADVILGREFQGKHKSITLEYGGPEAPLTVCSLTAMKVEPPELFCNPVSYTHLTLPTKRIV